MSAKLLVPALVLTLFLLPGCETGPNKAVRLTSGNFTDTVLKSKRPVLVDFWAPWCGPCRTMDPVIKSIASEFEGRFVVGQVNVDDYPDIARQYGIEGIPAFLIFKNGELKHQLMGVNSRQSLTDVLLALQ